MNINVPCTFVPNTTTSTTGANAHKVKLVHEHTAKVPSSNES